MRRRASSGTRIAEGIAPYVGVIERALDYAENMYLVHRSIVRRWAPSEIAFVALALVVAAFHGSAGAQAAAGCSDTAVATSAGPVCGVAVVIDGLPGVRAFLGIPYAEAPEGPLRWRPPVARAPWSAPLAADAFGARCPQNSGPEAATTTPMAEDCLSLNVWTPAADDAGRAVFVFIHGGAFTTGSSAAEHVAGGPYLYDGARFAASQDVVVVTLNYRLGALGFLAGLGDLRGNYGLLDQQLALTWVRENAAAFGGDPRRVTLAGESAGAASVAAHLVSMPSSRPLFLSAVLQSNPAAIPFKDLDDAGGVAPLFSLAAGCGTRVDQVACLRDAPVERVLAAQASRLLGLSVIDLGIDGLLTWSPTVDGELVVDRPMRAMLANGTSKPMLIGTNAGEGYIFTYGDGGRMGRLGYAAGVRVLLGGEAAELLATTVAPGAFADHRQAFVDLASDYLFRCANQAFARQGRAPVYVYEFDHVASFNLLDDYPVCADHACHADELPFVFGSAGGSKPFTDEERELSDRMMAAWGAFVRSPVLRPPADATGDLRWPTFDVPDERVLELAVPIRVRAPNVETCDVYQRIGFDAPAMLEVLPSP